MHETVGTIGQRYESHKSGKSGVLIAKDEEKRVFRLLDPATGDPFEVTFASFRSNWRRATDENNEIEPVQEEVVEKYVSAQLVPNDVLIDNFINGVGEVRKIHFTENPKSSTHTKLVMDGRTVLELTADDGGVRIKCLPDLYTYSDLKEHVVAGTIKFDVDQKMSVSFISDLERFGDILEMITDTAKDLNLYGYIAD